MITVEFRDVGRDKKTWRARLHDLTHCALERSVRNAGALMSSDICFTLPVHEKPGLVLVGPGHKVGEIHLVDFDSEGPA